MGEGHHSLWRASVSSPIHRLLPAASMTGIISAVVATSLWRHDMWFDELQAWGIARSSHDLDDLLHNLEYEGHPPLWHLVLFVLTRFTGDPHAMQMVSWVVATMTIGLIMIFAPWPRWARLASAASYFVVFEFSVLSRSYGLGLLLIIASLVAHDRGLSWLQAALLSLVAFTSLVGAAVALTLVVVLARARALVHAAIVLTAVVASAVLAAPPSDSAVGSGFGETFQAPLARRVLSAIAAPLAALLPVPEPNGRWGSFVVDHLALEIRASLAVALVLAIAAMLPGDARALWAVGVGGFMCFFMVAYPPNHPRHIGHIAVLLFVACWIDPPRLQLSLNRALIGTVLVAQLLAAGLVTGRYYFRDFGENEVVAARLQAFGSETVLVAEDAFVAVSVSAYLDRDIHTVPGGGPTRFIVYSEAVRRQHRANTRERTLAMARGMAAASDDPVVVLLRSAPELVVLD